MKPKICILILGILSVFLSQVKADEVIVVKTGQGTSGCDETPVLDYNQDSQEFTVDFGEVDEISGGRVVIHDDSGGYQVKNFLVTPACHEFTFICPLQGTLYITITTPHGDTYAGATEN